MRPELTMGPICYHWSPDRMRDFYARIADESLVDTVYLGEVICSKRTPFFEKELPGIISRMIRAGKKVVLSSIAEVMLPRERKAIAALAANERHEIEINNVAGLFSLNNQPHRIGPFMNAYNEATIEWLARQGATHVCLPCELPGKAVAFAAQYARKLGLGVEVQVFGRMPLAISARCYHARAHGRTKDNCLFVCGQDPDGMPLATRDNKPILRINGTQTQSESYLNLLAETESLVAMGVSHLRLSPQDVDMVAIAELFSMHLDGRISAEEAMTDVEQLCDGKRFGNGFFHGTAGYRRIAFKSDQVDRG